MSQRDYFRQLDEAADRAADEAQETYARAHEFYKDTLKVLASQLAKHRFQMDGDELESMMEGIQERMWGNWEISSASDALKEVNQDGSIYPDNCKALCKEAGEALLDEFRIKPIDWAGELTEMLRPLAVFRDPATNPATRDLLAQVSEMNIKSRLTSDMVDGEAL